MDVCSRSGEYPRESLLHHESVRLFHESYLGHIKSGRP